VYAWIWRRLPYGVPGKLGGFAALVVSIVALLWYVIFPAVEPNMPFNDGQMHDSGGGGTTQSQPAESPPAQGGSVRPPGGSAKPPGGGPSAASPSSQRPSR
jgi:hypothetical protein